MFLSLLFHMVQEEVVSDFSVFSSEKDDDQDQEQIRVRKSSQMTHSRLSNLSLVARAKSPKPSAWAHGRGHCSGL